MEVATGLLHALLALAPSLAGRLRYHGAQMGWTYLLLAVLVEVIWASTLKWTDGFTRFMPSLLNLTLAVANVILLSKAMKLLPTALAYSVWTGLGAVGVALVAYFLQGETFSVAKAFCILLIAGGVVGLKVFSPS